MAGTRIGSSIVGPFGELFRLADFLGHGAFGEVYRVVGVDSGRVLAAKLLPIQEVSDPDSRTALLNEITLARQIRHPNVVQILHMSTVIESGDEPYLMMEYISHGNLASILDGQKSAEAAIPFGHAREMMLDIAQGARAINERLVHRDIKPDNILFDGLHLKISDFGISKVIDERTRTHTFKGGQHVRYMAPEGWELKTNTSKLDVYSVGLVFYEILTLTHPLLNSVADLSDWREWRKAHLYAACPDVRTLRPDVSNPIAQLLLRMTAKRANERPEWDETIALLSSSAEEEPKTSRMIGAVERAINRQQEIEKANLSEAEEAERQAREEEFYRHACNTLLERFDRLVDEFNASYQHGRITIQPGRNPARTYRLPTGGSIECDFFVKRETQIRLAGGLLVGGGYLGAERNVSGNLALVREGDEDLYGRWVGYLIGVRATVNPTKLIGTRGLGPETVIPFGFRRADDFYAEMRHAVGVTHVFTYELREDVEGLFIDILENGLQGSSKSL